MGELGLYRPGDSVVHRLPAGVKLLVLAAVGVASVWVQRSWVAVVVALAVSVVGYLVARLRLRDWWRQLRPLLLILLVTGLFHLIVTDWRRALAMTGIIAVLVVLAGLVTLTTRTEALVDAAVRAVGPLRRLGIDPQRVGLLLTLGIRCVPLVADLAQEVREAQIARRATWRADAFVVPLLVRALRRSDALGEALVARGVDD